MFGSDDYGMDFEDFIMESVIEEDDEFERSLIFGEIEDIAENALFGFDEGGY